MPAPAITVTDILISPAWLFYAPVGTAIPASNIGPGGNWGVNWTPLGSTLTPVTLAYEEDSLDLKVQQNPAPVRMMRTGERVMLETSLAEINGTNLQLLLDGVKTTSAAGASISGMDTIEMGGKRDMSVYAWGLEGTRVTSAGVSVPVRVLIYRGVVKMSGSMQFSQDEGVGLPIQIQALADVSKVEGKQLMLFQNITAPPTSGFA